jgi:hypothetical protein
LRPEITNEIFFVFNSIGAASAFEWRGVGLMNLVYDPSADIPRHFGSSLGFENIAILGVKA